MAFLELGAGLIKRVQAFLFGVMGRFHFSRFGGYVVILVLAVYSALKIPVVAL